MGGSANMFALLFAQLQPSVPARSVPRYVAHVWLRLCPLVLGTAALTAAVHRDLGKPTSKSLVLLMHLSVDRRVAHVLLLPVFLLIRAVGRHVQVLSILVMAAPVQWQWMGVAEGTKGHMFCETLL